MQLFPRSIEKYLSKVKGPVIIYVQVAGGGGGGEEKIYWKDQKFFKVPPADHVNSKWPPLFIQYLRDDPPTSYLLLYALQSNTCNNNLLLIKEWRL